MIIKYFRLILLFCIVFQSCSYSPIFNEGDIDSNILTIESRRTISISSKLNQNSTTALMFYPGGLVDSHVYNELLTDFVSATDIPVIVVKMPGNLAVFDINAANTIISENSQITSWIIAGHSLGGSMAASTLYNNPDLYKGIIFMDSYPPDGNSLKEFPGAVLSLYSSIEKVNDPDKMSKTLSLLPPTTSLTDISSPYPEELTNYSVLHQIDGGSHSYFGSYGPQDGDYTPTVTRDEFHSEVIAYMKEFFNKNGWVIEP